MSTHTSTVNFVNIPAELKSSCRFCTWKMERGAKSSRLTKVPYKPGTNKKAQTNNPDTFSDFTDAMKAYAMGGYDGIGIRVASGIGAIDIDHCIREDGTLNDVAASVLGIFKDAYFERSPSGSGLRGFFQVDADYIFDKTVYYINNRTHGLEVYLPGATSSHAPIFPMSRCWNMRKRLPTASGSRTITTGTGGSILITSPTRTWVLSPCCASGAAVTKSRSTGSSALPA